MNFIMAQFCLKPLLLIKQENNTLKRESKRFIELLNISITYHQDNFFIPKQVDYQLIFKSSESSMANLKREIVDEYCRSRDSS